jgi:hypothetical protein
MSLPRILGQQQVRPVWKRHVIVGRQRIELKPMPVELQFRDDLGRHEREDVGEGGHRVSGPWVLADGGPAEHAPSFQHQGLQTRPAEIGRSSQPIVPAADDDRVVFDRHVGSIPSLFWSTGP